MCQGWGEVSVLQCRNNSVVDIEEVQAFLVQVWVEADRASMVLHDAWVARLSAADQQLTVCVHTVRLTTSHMTCPTAVSCPCCCKWMHESMFEFIVCVL